eukprot:CAMPEP_0181203412 /NCGR_PEP_ID=MMETSP1096-20121128/19370_1 /TAXON_ID=156174 ORGANISM="Chrysochromulina ericina, Strain CCMP281" /NCGR_SAMPLE_ID=MMETSP1096 /ASSEMBLY_ACC=CAM_ASM_000453 /LENGTH=269 /DNA_ID=CAMNT_0023294007 /DNA_START=193 /DNA_END=999 /DNA_ORIENTATION=-
MGRMHHPTTDPSSPTRHRALMAQITVKALLRTCCREVHQFVNCMRNMCIGPNVCFPRLDDLCSTNYTFKRSIRLGHHPPAHNIPIPTHCHHHALTPPLPKVTVTPSTHTWTEPSICVRGWPPRHHRRPTVLFRFPASSLPGPSSLSPHIFVSYRLGRQLQQPEDHDMLRIGHAKLVEDRVSVLCARPGVLRARQVEPADEHEPIVPLDVLEALPRVGRAVDAVAEHRAMGNAHASGAGHQQPACLDIGNGHLGRAVKEERVGLLAVRFQ